MFTKIYVKIKEFIVENYKQLIFLLGVFLLFYVELPFVVYTPGGIIDLDDRIKVEDGYEYDGTIGMSYVSMLKGNVPFILLSYVMPNWDLTKAEDVTYEGDSVSETLKKDHLQTNESIDNAVVASYTLANKKVKITKYHNKVIYIVDEAETTLKDYDEIISINGTKVTSLEQMKSIVNTYQKNDILNIKIIRDKKEMIATAKVFETNDGLKVGVSIVTSLDYETNPKIKLSSKNSESGPSGGLMLSLGIYNTLVKEDITKGKKIVGTGTIDVNGNVGPIGGVKYKILGAIKKKADVFLCPEENYDEALKIIKENKTDLKLIKVKTLEEAVRKLNNL